MVRRGGMESRDSVLGTLAAERIAGIFVEVRQQKAKGVGTFE